MKGQVAVVTGAGAGIGKAAALQLGAEGATVVVADIHAERGRQTVEEIAAGGGRAELIETDLRDVDSIRAMADEAVERVGPIAMLVNNAGLTHPQQFLDITPEEWDAQHSVNARGAFFCLQAVARKMVEQGEGGRIVNVASIAALGFRHTTSAAYSASKAALLISGKVAAHSLTEHGIRVNAVCPGPTYTDFYVRGRREEREKGELPEEKRKILYEGMDPYVPLGRANTPDDVANVILFLLSEKASTINGSAYVVDGGVMLH